MTATFYSILTPYFGNPDPDHMACIYETVNRFKCDRIHLKGAPYIDMARAVLADKAMEDSRNQVIFFIDHDMIFDPADVDAMARRCLDSEYDIVGGAYAMKQPGGSLTCGTELKSIVFYSPGIYPAVMLPLGFTAIKRHVFEELGEKMGAKIPSAIGGPPVHPFFSHEITDRYYGEDVSFMRRCMKHGFKLGLDAEPRLFHRGGYDYKLEDAGNAIQRFQTLEITFKPPVER
jgi:hypothetical protein